MITRREALLTGLFGAGTVGLRALATGLPAWFIANPSRATAQSLQCAITAKDKLQYLIICVSSNGDPINCNCPGTYLDSNAIHPQQALMAATAVQLGSTSFQAALPWASTANGGQIDPAVLARICFFHHMTRSTVHGDQPKVMRRLGATNGGEMMVSFGGDNHTDNNLQAEVDQHAGAAAANPTKNGCTGIQNVINELGSNSLGLTDKVTFATWNVFGRNLNGIDKVTQRQGRDHYGNHSVGVMIGKNVAAGVIGGVTPLASGTGGVTSGSLAAADIDSASGAATPGGDIPGASTHIAYARTLGVALGIPSDQVNSDLIVGAGGKVVNAALNGVSG